MQNHKNIFRCGLNSPRAFKWWEEVCVVSCHQSQRGDENRVRRPPMNVSGLLCLSFSAVNTFFSGFVGAQRTRRRARWMPIMSKRFRVIVFVVWMNGSSEDNIHPRCPRQSHKQANPPKVMMPSFWVVGWAWKRCWPSTAAAPAATFQPTRALLTDPWVLHQTASDSSYTAFVSPLFLSESRLKFTDFFPQNTVVLKFTCQWESGD